MSSSKALVSLLICSILLTFASSAGVPFKVLNYQAGGNSISALLAYDFSNSSYYLKPTSPWVQALNFNAKFEGDNELQITITDATNQRFTLPYSDPFPYTKELPPLQTPAYTVNVTQEPFSFAVIRTSTNETVFNTSGFDLIYSDLAIQVGFQVPTKYLYGLGERRSNFLFRNGTYTIYNKDQFPTENGTANNQLYGTHPVYLMREASKNWHVVLFRNINPMDFIFDEENRSLTFKTIGGIIEFKYFFGDKNPESAIKQYHRYLNGVALTPFWAHGWHQSRWGYRNLSQLQTVVQKYHENNLPIDTIWSDIDYMSNYQDFTVSSDFDPENFTNWLQSSPGLHWVPILDPGIAIGDNPAYKAGIEKNLFIKSPNTGKPLKAKVWPGYTHFPDFANPAASDYWGYFCNSLHDMIPFSGLWIDMNELANFCDGECDVNVTSGLTSDALPYVPSGGNLEHKSTPLGAIHYGGFLEKDVHNSNGFMEAVATRKFFTNQLKKPLPFILSRSTMFGSGSVAQHWTGDIFSDYDHLRYSISEIFNHQLFGLPMVGADICGFMGDTTEELCSYWTQLGSLYPFARNHNNYSSIDQEPWSFGETLLETNKAALGVRYSILKWYYSIFVRNGGAGTVFRPTFFNFPDDDNLLDLQTQFMVGSELLAVPCLTNATNCTANVYFPNASKFYDFNNYSTVHDYADANTTVNISVPLKQMLPLFIQSNSTIYKQDVTGVNSSLFLNNKFTLLIAFHQVSDSYYVAQGTILGVQNYSDETGVAQKCTGSSNCLVIISAVGIANGTAMNVELSFDKYNNQTVDIEPNQITKIVFLGVKTVPCAVGNTTCNADFFVEKDLSDSPLNVTEGIFNYVLTKPTTTPVVVEEEEKLLFE
eukprot:CAMPEP_0176461894 /NCGR_PEP_ID=MMETSP0127-20121128/34928_1 /TAXON_ID=938130 /ORGANISM="Platyophrya macrostoma, Strain WH" /LENGTH=876 /DNA_ID=CAMNT_0017853677 /DNA_START=14 /DNA_END=2644 /DNA_ORIENTATION=-